MNLLKVNSDMKSGISNKNIIQAIIEWIFGRTFPR